MPEHQSNHSRYHIACARSRAAARAPCHHPADDGEALPIFSRPDDDDALRGRYDQPTVALNNGHVSDHDTTRTDSG